MNRFASKTSLADSTTSSRMNKNDNTHVIIQNPIDNKGLIKYISLPIKNLVNFGRPLKVNDLATYKIDAKGRGTNRGKIILFGSEDDCAEQVQVLSSVAEENEPEPSDIVGETFDTCDISSFDDSSLRRVHDKKEKNKENVDKKQSFVPMMKKPFKKNEKDSREHQLNKEEILKNFSSNKNETISKSKIAKPLNDKPLNINRMNLKVQNDTHLSLKTLDETFAQPKKSTTDRTTGNQKTLDQMLKKVVVFGQMAGTESSISYEKIGKSPSASVNTISSSKNIHTQKTSTLSSKSSAIATNQKQNINNKGSELNDDNRDCTNEEERDVHSSMHELWLDLDINDKDYYVKQYNTLYRQNQILKMKYDKLVLAHRQLRKNTIPMPNETVRNWIIGLSRLLGPKLHISTEAIATALGVDPVLLNGCRQNTATHTTREIIKLIYTPEQLKTKRGPNVSPEKRKLVKEYVEQQHGVILDERPFKEAINGVFRSSIHNEKKQKKVIKVVEKDPDEHNNDQLTMYDDEIEDDFNYYEEQNEDEDDI